MFDVFSQKADVSGRLIKQSDNYLVYLNTNVFNENGVKNIIKGSSYEVVTKDSIDNITFESASGSGDGLTAESILSVLVDHIEQNDEKYNNDALSLLKQALTLLEPKLY